MGSKEASELSAYRSLGLLHRLDRSTVRRCERELSRAAHHPKTLVLLHGLVQVAHGRERRGAYGGLDDRSPRVRADHLAAVGKDNDVIHLDRGHLGDFRGLRRLRVPHQRELQGGLRRRGAARARVCALPACACVGG
jgi:hypothetical protein